MFSLFLRWFSSRDDDGQIVRDLPVSDVIPGKWNLKLNYELSKLQIYPLFNSMRQVFFILHVRVKKR